jgi:hypothetical protein
LSVQAIKTARITNALSSQFTETVLISKRVNASAALASIATFTTSATVVSTASANISASATLSCQVARTRQGLITAEVVASQVTVAIKTARAQANIASSASLSITASRTRGAAAVIDTSFFKQTTNVGKLISGECGTIPFIGLPVPIWFVVATLTANAARLRVVSVAANINAAASLTCQPVKSISAISLEASSGTLAAAVNVKRSATVNLSALAFEIAVGQRVKSFQVNITSQSTLTATPSRQRLITVTANLTGFAATVTVIDIVHIDAKLTWMIPAEDRDYLIIEENRVYSIIEENREYTLQGA